MSYLALKISLPVSLVTIGLLSTVAVLVSAAENTADRTKSDLAAFQGNWTIVSIAFADKVLKKADKIVEWQSTFNNAIVIKDDRFTHRPSAQARFTLAADVQPKQITFHSDDGKLTFRGIYSLADDSLKICVHGDGANSLRPASFATKAGAPILLIELKKLPAVR